MVSICPFEKTNWNAPEPEISQLAAAQVQSNMQKYMPLVAVTLFGIFAVSTRIIPLGWNFAAMGAFAVFCGGYLRGFKGVLLPVAVFAGSDWLGEWLGLSSFYRYHPASMAMNYLALASMGGVGHFLSRDKGNSLPKTVLVALGGSISFFLISNFGSWLDPAMGDYEKSFGGLVTCYINAIPFFRNTLSSDLVFSVVFVLSFDWARRFLLANRPVATHAD